MHFRLYMCLPIWKAKTSREAREAVCSHLDITGFTSDRPSCRRADYFKIGGRWSGSLILHRLKAVDARLFIRFWKSLEQINSRKVAVKLFRKTFPDYRGKMIPLWREQTDFLGCPDDAQIMDKALFKQLKQRFVEDVTYEYEFGKADVICTEKNVDWPPTGKKAIGKYWVVVVDYHD